MDKQIFILGILMACLVSSCESDLQEEIKTGQLEKVPLSIQVATGEVEDAATKVLVEGNSLPVGSEIGLRVVQAGKSTYDGTTYENVKYSFDGAKWNVENDVLLSATPGMVYAYYPWKSGVNLTSVPLDVNGDDFMWATSASVDIKNSSATLAMKHALSQVLVTIQSDGYTGTGKVTGFSWSSNSAGNGGTLNAISGNVTASNAGYVFNSGLSGENSQSVYVTTDYNFLVVPSGTKASPTFSITMDGYNFSATGGEVEFKSGMRYTYNLVMKNKAHNVGGVTVTQWGTSNQGTLNPS